MALWSAPAAAEPQDFNIPEGEARSTIPRIAVESGLQVLAPEDALSGVRTKPVHGSYEPIEALRQMLAGSGLVVQQTGPDSVTVTRSGGTGPVDTDEMPQNEIVVTGSRIPKPGYDTLEAAIVTGEEQIERRGYTNVVQALDDTPGFSASGVNPVGRDQLTLNTGQSFADFLGLGSQRTLTLVNSRRFVSSNTVAGSGSTSPGQQVDLNAIPVGLIERVETIAIGGAPIYGSDAIAGTVNIILKDDYEGLELFGQYGVAEEGDGASWTLRALGGTNFAEGRGNIALAAEYNKQDGLLLSERAGSHILLPSLAGDPPRIISEDLVFGTMTEGGLPYSPFFGNIVDASGQALQFANGGDLVPFVPGDPLIAPLFFNGGDGVRHADHLSLLAPTERILLNGFGHYDLTPNIRFVAEANYAHTEGEDVSDLTLFSDPFQVGNFLPISIDNPFLSPAARATLIANGVTTVFPMARNFGDLLERDGNIFKNTTDLYRVVAGLEGDITLFGSSASWDVSFNYGRSRTSTATTYVNNDRFLEAVDAVRDASGDIVCASGNPTCVPINLFGVNAFSDAAADYVTDDGSAISLNKQYVATANLGGALPVNIATDPVRFNVGVEWRKESGSFTPGSLLSRPHQVLGFTYASPFQGAAGSFTTREAYGELSIPLISDDQDLPVVKSLSLDGSIRYVDNSIAGGDITWSAGARLAPRLPGIGDGLLFRGVYTEAIRAPAITELFSGASPTRGSIQDPCGQALFQAGPNPAVREANCRAALDALGTTPEAFAPTTFALSAIGTVSGNPDLENEKAKSWSVGVVYQPAMIPGFRVAADWIDIELTGGIESLGIGTLIDACYDSPDFPNEPACDNFRRLTDAESGPGSANPVRMTGDIADGYQSGFVNVSSLERSALLISAEYGFDLQNLLGTQHDAGALNLGAKVIHNDKFILRTTPGSPAVNQAGNASVPEWTGQFNIGYADETFDLLLQALWTDAVKIDQVDGDELLGADENSISSHWMFNGTVGFTIRDRYRLQFVVNNIFDQRPTRAEIFTGNFGRYGLIGRRFLVSAGVEF